MIKVKEGECSFFLKMLVDFNNSMIIWILKFPFKFEYVVSKCGWVGGSISMMMADERGCHPTFEFTKLTFTSRIFQLFYTVPPKFPFQSLGWCSMLVWQELQNHSLLPILATMCFIFIFCVEQSIRVSNVKT